MVTNNYSAEYGRVAGAVITVVTKTGTNALHGSAWEFLRNSSLDANNFIANRTGVGKLPFRQHQFGATFGGPIRKNRTFYFGSYEGLHSRKSRVQSLITMTANERQGIFGKDGLFVKALTYDPLNVVDGARAPFPGNTLPATRISAVAKAIVDDNVFIPPLPNQPDGVYPNFYWASRTARDGDKVSWRTDHNVTDKDSVFLRWTWQHAPTVQDFNTPNVQRGSDFNKGQQVALGYVKTLSPSMTNELTVSVARKVELQYSPDGVNYTEKYGFSFARLLPRAAWGMPRTTISGYAQIRTQGGEHSQGTNGGLKDIFSVRAGGHLLKTGFHTQRYKQVVAQGFNPGGGTISFDGYATAQVGGVQGQPFGDFLLGYASSTSYQLNFDTFNTYPTKSFYNWFVSDDWKVSSKVTLTLGLRHEISLPIVYADNKGLAFFDLGSDRMRPVARFPKGAPVASILGGPLEGPNRSPIPARVIDTRRVSRTDYRDFAPRVGIAWRPFGGNRTAIRAGYGISYDDASFNYMSNAGALTTLSGSYSGNQTRFQPPTLILGQVPGTLAAAPTQWPSNYLIDPNWTPAYIQNWSFSVQRELVTDMKLEVAYVGNKGTHLFGQRNFNVAVPAGVPFTLPTGETLIASGTSVNRRAYPPITPNRFTASDANSSYNSLQTRLEQRFSSGLSLVSGYTWAKTMVTSWQEAVQNEYDRSKAHSVANWNATHAFFLAGLWELPRLSWFHGVPSRIVNGWQLNALVTVQSGPPVLVGVSGDPLDIGTRRIILPDRSCNGSLPEGQRTVDRYFDTGCFSVNRTTYGNSSPFPFSGDGLANLDLGLTKQFALAEGWKLDFRSEFFNVLNTHTFGPPDGNIDLASAGRITTASMARQIQFGLRLSF